MVQHIAARGQTQNGYVVLRSRHLANRPAHLHAIHVRHEHVHEHDVNRCCFQQFKGRSARVDGVDMGLRPDFLNHALRHQQIDRVIIHDQQARWCNGGRPICRVCRRGIGDGEGHFQPEQGPLIDMAVHAHAATLQLNQLVADRQTQAGATINFEGVLV